jgi:murein endopeptidase
MGGAGTDPDINVPLPRDGVGFKSYKPQDTQYGFQQTIDFVVDLGARWNGRYPDGPRLLIGDLSVFGGGRTPKQWGHPERGYHLSHGSGLDFDVQIIRTDDVEQPRSVQVTDHEPSKYDRARTLELVRIIHELGGDSLKMVLSADRALKTPLTGKVIFDGTHTYHLHVRLARNTEGSP